ncbi:hypothetical protein [Bordetella genomosp. 11]|uniref:Lipoprotein n=1 Tax=Bordetella genomosp. 11 TaxID=1416808 RepID=A0A261UHY3_9BORD|nr:hypothetical protein [Bordetella genomosp. 11]OZI61548.1 hypothetical protein CAL28_19900 [Bordetella genomosp. 11]
MNRLLCFAVLLMITACASVPDVKTAPKVAPAAISDEMVASPHAGAGEVTFKRDSWPLHAYRLPIYVDGKQIATIGNGEVLNVYLAAGRRLVGTGKVNESKPDAEVAVDVSEGKETFVHLTLSAWGWGGWNISQSSY